MRRLLAIVLLATFSVNANALSILLAGGARDRDTADRLVELGHTVTKVNAAWFHASWDYSPYDVLAMQYGTNEVADIDHLVSTVQAGELGVVFFRAWGAEQTASALGMVDLDQIEPGSSAFNWQYAQNNFNVVDNSHYITQGVSLGQHDLGYTYMTDNPNPGADTTVLATGANGATLIVHNTLRVVTAPFYGNVAGWDDETEFSMQLTENTLQWAAGAGVNPNVVPIPAAVWLFASGLGLLGWMRRKRAS